MRVYVAGGSDERLTVIRPLMAALRESGIGITYDWTHSPGYDRALTPAEIREQAVLDLQAVKAADLIWYVAPEAKSEGSHGELVAALALAKPVVASGRHAVKESRIFVTLVNWLFATHDAALRAIVTGKLIA